VSPLDIAILNYCKASCRLDHKCDCVGYEQVCNAALLKCHLTKELPGIEQLFLPAARPVKVDVTYERDRATRMMARNTGVQRDYR
jgi:hypothetical protein